LYLHDSKNADVSLITTKKTNPHGYGRVFLKGDFIERIVEEKDCNDLERENPLINAGIYCFNWSNLSEIINTLQSNNNQKEFAEFCYGNMPSCKEGDEFMCEKNSGSIQ